jgi:tetratricopeptide (TPR) repeat protein
LSNKIVIADSEAESLYQSSLHLFDNAKFENSIEKLENAIELRPDVAKYHHILAKSYGRLAEESGWLKAIKLAKETLRHLELAAELDPKNTEILSDLMKYYQEAPIFLGGSTKKANKINEKIKDIECTKVTDKRTSPNSDITQIASKNIECTN